MYTDIHTGLTQQQVEDSRAKYGSNFLTPPTRTPWWVELLEKFTDPLIVILMVAAIISLIPVLFVSGHSWVESAGIIGAVLLATVIGFINEYRANREFDILNKVKDVTPVRVTRDGQHVCVPKNELVVGDIVILETGEEIPADGEMLETANLHVDQSTLTGESLPVLKQVAVAGREPERGAYPEHVVLRGTMVTEGTGVMCVTHVGDATEIGKVARAAAEVHHVKSPLNRQLEELSKGINVMGSSIAFFLFVSLVTHDTMVGTFTLTAPQWGVLGIIALSVAVALLRVWYPILQDLLGYMRMRLGTPKLVERGGALPWLLCLLAGLCIFGVGMGIMIGCDYVAADATTWLPTAAAEDFLLYFMIAITLIVVAVPEGLPMSVTLSLAYSMRKMAKQHYLVRRMDACETIGAATVVCSDKTGTLTLNRMSVRECCLAGARHVDEQSPVFPLFAESVAVNSTADLDAKGNVLGNVTEGAMLRYLAEHGCPYDDIRARVRVVSRLPFSGVNKFMATCAVSRAMEGESLIFIKGAPEILLARCTRTTEGTLDHAARDTIQQQISACQREAMRVLALAYKKGEATDVDALSRAVTHDLVWLGYVAIQDPVRPDVPDAVAACVRGGVDVKMVTGDNPETACRIGREIGLLPEYGQLSPYAVLTGDDLTAMSDEDFEGHARDIRILSRAKPMDKLRLVSALQKRDQVVAVTGDGTNDAPALNHADVGLSMGMTGTSVAKEASDIVLLDDSFSGIAKAIKWGRSLYRNIQKFIVYQLTVNVAACGIAALGPFIGCDLPLTVTQMLWVNLIMDTFAALALATEPPDEEVMHSGPRDKNAFIITPAMWRWILLFGGAFIIAPVMYVEHITAGGAVPSTHDVTVLFTGFVMLQFWNLFNARVYGSHRSFLKGITRNLSFVAIALVVLIGQFLAVQYGGSIFRTEPLALTEWLTLAVITCPVLLIGELVRFIARIRGRS